jgi:hypothetical protein
LSSKRYGLERATADHVESEGADGVGEASAESCLASGVLAEASGEHTAHDAFVDTVGIESSTADSFTNHDSAKVDGGDVAERPEELADGGADGANDGYIFH